MSCFRFFSLFRLCCRLSLTSSQPHTRARGVQLLSEVLQECYGNLTERQGTRLLHHLVLNCLAHFFTLWSQRIGFIYKFVNSLFSWECHNKILKHNIWINKDKSQKMDIYWKVCLFCNTLCITKYFKITVLLLHSGSAHCFLWKPSKGPLCRHITCFTGAQSTGECLCVMEQQHFKHPVWD